ncbi:unnamed protein product [Blepharisma stoltei]|uniref:Importin subunit alpha n=1 Tax=Blepharisma stoltei TaxID=1481888 RepID=A0AAU9II39_9CILI|nr:unnamed protein product [Blepharisma stoltei]
MVNFQNCEKKDFFETRQKNFMKIDDDFKLKREIFAIELRKHKRYENHMKFARITYKSPKKSQKNSEKRVGIENIWKNPCLLEFHLSSLANMVWEDNDAAITICNGNFLPFIVSYIDNKYQESTITDAAKCLCKISALEHKYVKCLIKYGAHKKFVGILDKTRPKSNEFCIWALGNISADCTKYRDKILSLNIVFKLINLMLENPGIDTIALISWTFSKLTREKPAISASTINSLLGACNELLKYPYRSIKKDTLFAISYISEYDEIDTIFSTGIISKIFNYLIDNDEFLLLPSIRIIGNLISKQCSLYTQSLLEKGILDYLCFSAKSSVSAVRKEIQWTLCNIAAGTQSQVKRLIEHRIIWISIECLGDFDTKTRIEASYIFGNIAKSGNITNIKFLVDKGILGYIKQNLRHSEYEYLVNLLEFCSAYLMIEDRNFNFHYYGDENYKEMNKSGCLEEIENLIMSKNQKVHELSSNILQAICIYEEDTQFCC